MTSFYFDFVLICFLGKRNEHSVAEWTQLYPRSTSPRHHNHHRHHHHHHHHHHHKATAATRATLPIPTSVCYIFVCPDNGIRLPVFGIFNTCTGVEACDCTQGLYGHRKRVCTKSRLREKNPSPHRGSQTCINCAWLNGRTLYQNEIIIPHVPDHCHYN